MPYFDQLDVDVITFEGAFNRGMDFEAIGKGISKDKKIAHRRHQPSHVAGRAAR